MEINKALYTLLHCEDIQETATDIYWGNSSHFDEKEKAEFDEDDYNRAYHFACLEMIERVRWGNDFPYKSPDELADTSPAWDKMLCAMADLFGKHLRLIDTEKTLR